jgi:ribosomal protein S18 acetylase RimI-like enzyme
VSAPEWQVRVMSRADLDTALDWAAAEGWNPGLHDAQAFHAADPQGFLAGVLDGEVVASISVVRYDAAFGFLGFYIVKPGYRGRGFGKRIWDAGMGRLAGANVGLDGVVAQQQNYRRSGFRYAYANQRYAGTAAHGAAGGTVAVGDVGIERIAEYDRRCFPAPRRAFLERWLDRPGATALALPGGDGVRGYGVVRACREGHKIGPLFADTPALAQTLFGALAASVAGDTLFLDVPMPNTAAVALAEAHGMQPVFETARMYTGEPPAVDLARVFGVTTFELG